MKNSSRLSFYSAKKKKSHFGQMIQAVVLHLFCHERGCFRMKLLIFCNQKIALERK